MPPRCTTRSIDASSKSRLSARSALSKTSLTPARPARGDVEEPFHIKSSPRLPRMLFIDCTPSTKRKDSATLDLPEPLGPTIAVMAVANSKEVFLAKDLNPDNSIDFNRIAAIVPNKKAPHLAMRGISHFCS